MTKLFLVVNVDWFFLSHRLPIALEAQKRGYDVTILAIEEEGRGDDIRSYGFEFIPLPSSRGGKNVWDDIKMILFLFKIYKKEKPDIIHHVAIKPVLYGSLAARYAKMPKVINAVSGLGSNFTNTGKEKMTTKLIKLLYRRSQSYKNISVIVQNQDDRTLLKKITTLTDSSIHLIKGSGVDLSIFKYKEEISSDVIKVILISRMLWDKGIQEFVDAAMILKKKHGDNVTFILVGKTDPQNSSSIPINTLDQWNKEENVEWLGFRKDIKELNEQSHIAVLPSYREGLPKSLIEALAIGRPIVTTDVPGCREVVIEGENGYLVPMKNVSQLADAIGKLIDNKSLRVEMGKKGRTLVEKEMSLQIVLDKTFAIYEG